MRGACGRTWFDATLLRGGAGQPNGVSRVVLSLLRELERRADVDLRPFAIDDGWRLRDASPSVAPTLWTRAARRWRRAFPPKPRIDVDLRPGDVLFSPGGGWTSDPEGRVAAAVRRAGGHVAVLHLDLLPATHPEFFEPHVSPIFVPWLRAMLATADVSLAISARTRDDLATFAGREGLPSTPCAVVRLGDHDPCAPSPTLDAAVRPFALCVGTLEIRKNHALLERVWRRLVERHGDRTPDLVLAGKPGWLTEEVTGRLRRLAPVRFVPDASDAQLERLYAECRFTLYPSRYEGWGLPVAESLARGKVCIASPGGAIPEIAATLTDLLDPDDNDAWLSAVERYTFDASARARREAEIVAGYRKTSWADTADQVVRALAKRLT